MLHFLDFRMFNSPLREAGECLGKKSESLRKKNLIFQLKCYPENYDQEFL